MRTIILSLTALTFACTGGDGSPPGGTTTDTTSSGAPTTGGAAGPAGDPDSGVATEPAPTTGASAATDTGEATGSTGAASGSTGPAPGTETGGEGSSSSGGPDELEPPCTSVEQLAVPNGLTAAMRQASGVVTGPLLPPGSFSLLEYSTLFGSSPSTYPVDEPDPTGFGFPGTNQNRLTFSMERDKYISLKFRAPTDGSWDQKTGAFFTIPAGTFFSVAIGRCPGQFADDPAWPMPAGCGTFGEGTLPWKINGELGCALKPGATYYVNAINAALDSPTDNVCMSDICKFKLMNNHNP